MGVYGEWCLAIHGVIYNNLPSVLLHMPFILQKDINLYLPVRRDLLSLVGFNLSPLLFKGKANLEQLKT